MWLKNQKPAWLLGRFFSSSERQFGMSLVEVLLGTGMLGLVATGSAVMLKNAFKNSRDNMEIQDRTAVGNYLLNFTDCGKTIEDPSYEQACKNKMSVNLRDKDNNIILDASGRKLENLFVFNSCDGGEISLTAKKTGVPSPFPLLGGVPIICGSNIPPNLSNPINMTINFASAGKKLTINLKFTTKSVVTDKDGRLIAEMSLDPASKKSAVTGDFARELERQLLAGEITARVVFDRRNTNNPYAFTAALSTKNLLVDGRNVGDQTFNMSQTGKTLNLENNEGNVKALESSIVKDSSSNCKITKNGQQPSSNKYYVVLTNEAPCDFQAPFVEVKHAYDSTKYQVPIGSYWQWDYNSVFGLCLGYHCNNKAHSFEITKKLNWKNNKDNTRTLFVDEGLKKDIPVPLAIDSGFLLAQPDGKVYLLADAGVAYFASTHKATEKIAEDLIADLKQKSKDTIQSPFKVQSFRDAGKGVLLKPSADTTFTKGSVIAIYDDTPDMAGNIDVDALVKYTVTTNIGLSWAVSEEIPAK